MKTAKFSWLKALLAVAMASALGGCSDDPEPTVHRAKAVRPAPAQSKPAPTWAQVDQRAAELEAQVADLEQKLR